MKKIKMNKGENVSKGVAIPYIISLILGIVVVALLGYWFFVLGPGISQNASLINCQSKLTNYCNTWRQTGYVGITDFTKACDAANLAGTSAAECCSYADTLKTTTEDWKTACQRIVG